MSAMFSLIAWAGLLALGEPAVPNAATAEKAGKSAKTDEKTVAKLLQVCAQDAAEYEIVTAAGGQKPGGEKLQLRAKPVFTWTNPTRQGGQYGAVFLWTSHGRPGVVGTIFTDPQPAAKFAVKHEFHSLLQSPFVAYRPAGVVQWAPDGPGVESKPVPDAPLPAKAAPARLLQMRNISREFTAESTDDRGRWELRLLPQPVYRFEPEGPDSLDGAVFVFATSAGTDPEVVLVLEERKSAAGGQWNYGVARFSDLNLLVKHKEKEIWSFRRGGQGPGVDAQLKDKYRFIHDRTILLGEEGASVVPQPVNK